MNKKICVGIPHTGLFNWQTTISLLSLYCPKGYDVLYHMVGSCLVYDARDKIVKYARANECEYIVMIDSDMVVPKDMLLKFVYVLENDKDIDLITGTIHKRTPPFQPCWYTKLEYDLKEKKPILESPVEFPDKGIMPIAGTGMAGCVMRTSIFDKIDSKSKHESYFYPLPNLGEDLTFCLLARKTGSKMVCDLSIDIGHVASFPIGKEHFRACYDEHKKTEESEPLFTEVEQ